MALPESVCTALSYGGQVTPYEGQIAGILLITAIIVFYLLLLLPVNPEFIPLIGVAISSYNLGKHPLIMLVITYLVISIAVVTELLPVCTVS